MLFSLSFNCFHLKKKLLKCHFNQIIQIWSSNCLCVAKILSTVCYDERYQIYYCLSLSFEVTPLARCWICSKVPRSSQYPACIGTMGESVRIWLKKSNCCSLIRNTESGFAKQILWTIARSVPRKFCFSFLSQESALSSKQCWWITSPMSHRLFLS